MPGASEGATVPMVFDRALTDVIMSGRLIERTEHQLVEALAILRSLDGGLATGRAGDGSARWADGLDACVRDLSTTRVRLRDLLEGLADAPRP